MAKLSAKKCPNCGAPLVLKPGVSDTPCQYCGNVIHVEWGRKAPPEQRPLTVYVQPTTPTALPVLILLGTLVPVIIPLALIFGPQLKQKVTEAAAEAGVVQQSFPIECGTNQEVSIVGQTFQGTGTLITGDVNCKIRIKNSKLEGDVVVAAKNLVEVTVENSTLVGKEAAVRLGMNSKVFGKQGSVFKGEEAAIVTGPNCEIGLTDSSVEGTTTGIRAEVNFKLDGNKAKITGGEYGIRAGSNLGVQGRELTVSGTRAALESEVNLKLEMRGGAFEGKEAAIRMRSSNAKIKLSHGARLTAQEAALSTESNLELEMEEALIDGGETGIEAGVNPKLNLGRNARIVGKKLGLKAGVNLDLRMRGATIESDSVAVCAPFNVEIAARESTIRGGQEAFRFQRRPQELTLESTSVAGAQVFNGSGCTPTQPRR